MTRTSREPSLPAITPRLLPLTVFCIAGLLAMKSVSLVRAAAPAKPEPAKPDPKKPAAAQQTPPAEAATQATGTGTAAPAATATPPISDSERAVLLELRERRQELEAREQTLSAREAILAAADRKIAARVDELKSLQARLEALDATRKEHDEANWQGLVKIYENMKPRDAATIMNDMEMAVLLPVLDRMKEAKVARILAAMQPDKARQATAELAQLRKRANSVAASAGG